MTEPRDPDQDDGNLGPAEPDAEMPDSPSADSEAGSAGSGAAGGAGGTHADQQPQTGREEGAADAEHAKAPERGQGIKEGLAGHMAHTFVRSPVTPLLYLAALLFGLIGFLVVPYQENPQISVPFVDIFVQYPGASSEQVERLVTEPLERLMSELDGIKHVYGVSRPGQAIVTCPRASTTCPS
ncbi:MAG: efflux RND transporter permease subunit [Gammaproteobacteria bacterium]